MVAVKKCDRCGSFEKVDRNELIEFFDGSLEIQNADLCENCFQLFAMLIDKFVKNEGGK